MKVAFLLLFVTLSLTVSATKYYVSPTGNDTSGDGSQGKPWFSLNKAWTCVSSGDTVYMRGGTYYYARQSLTGKDGSKDKHIRVLAYPGERPSLKKAGSFANIGWPRAILNISGDYIHIKGLEISYNTQENGEMYYGLILINGNHNIFELLDIHHIGGTGISVEYNSTNNLLLNCDVHHNADPLTPDKYGNAGGIGFSHLPEGLYNTVRGCRIWLNSDDGLDTYGSDCKITVENCWAWFNGYLSEKLEAGGNGTGFKLGITRKDYGNTILRTVRNCIAYKNRTSGFHQNGAVAAIELYNNTAYHNGTEGYWFGSYDKSHRLINNISYKDGSYCCITASSFVTANTFLLNNKVNSEFKVDDADFVSLDYTQLYSPRQSDGNLPIIEFLHLNSGSDLIDEGINVGLPYQGETPDLGAFETTPPAAAVVNQQPVVSISSPLKNASFTSPASVTVEASASDPDGAIIKVEFFHGNVKIGEKMTTPYTVTWGEVPEGIYSLTAIATDNSNLKTVSASVSITVANPATIINKMPLVSISSPTKGISFTAPATVTIDVMASDQDGSITKVELFNGTTKIYEKTAAPYSFTLKDLAAGSYELKAVATDNMKASSSSSTLNLTVTDYYEASDYFNLYPNPNDGRFSIDFTKLLEADNFTVTVVDLIGKTLYREEFSKNEGALPLDLSHLNSGIYVLMISAEQILLTQKFIKR
jgi:hypothetical protein